MQDTLVTGSKLTAIANAVRTRGGTQAQLTLDEMPTAVADIPGGGGGFDWSQVKGGIKFTNAATQTAFDMRGIDTSTFTTMHSMFESCSYLTAIDVSGFDTSSVLIAYMMFSNCSGLTSLALPAHDFLSAATDLGLMFSGCTSLTSLDLSCLDNGSATTMASMFNRCSSLTSINLSNISMALSPATKRMFSGCSALTDIIWATKRQTVQALPTTPSDMNITSTMQFYVPDDLVSAYQSATNWATIASQIHSINDLPASVAALYAGHY